MIPALSQEEYQNLEQSILAEGCRDSLVTWNGTIIDGHNRFEICTKHNVPFATKEQAFDSGNDVLIWMIKNQFGRRNLIPFIRAELALKLKGLFQEKAKDNLKVADRSANTRFENDKTNSANSGCQNSDKVTLDSSGDIEENGEQNPIEKPKNNSERAEEALKLKDKIPEIKPIDTKRELAQIAGVSHDTIERVKTIQEKAPDEVKRNLRSGDISIN